MFWSTEPQTRDIPSAEAFLQSLEEGEASKNYEQSAKAEISQRESYLTGGLAMSEQQRSLQDCPGLAMSNE